jgi:serine protease AprX
MAMLAASLATTSFAKPTLSEGQGNQPIAVIVRQSIGAGSAVERAIIESGGRISNHLGLIHSLSAVIPADSVRALSEKPGVLGIFADAPIKDSSYLPGDDPDSMFITDAKVGRLAMPKGGKGIGVALIDTGVTATSPLFKYTRIMQGPDLSFDSATPGLTHLDGYGHGTFMAGIIAGNDPSAANNPFYGLSPNATLINVKVGAADGAADVSQVIAGIDWVVQHRNDPGLNIKVLNLSLGYHSAQPYTIDPLAYAAEQAWFHGITVVAAAGNQGKTTGQLDSPAYDPYVIAVGAATYDGSGYSIPSFSSVGDGIRNPDLIAPGGHIASVGVSGSTVYSQYGSTANLGGGYFRGSGTSQAAAVVSGAVADVLGQKPNLTPDQVKGILVNSARAITDYAPEQQGSGIVNLWSAASELSEPQTAQSWTLSTGSGSLAATRNGNVLALNSSPDIFGSFNSQGLARAEASGSTWSGGTWSGSTWSGGTWSGSTWSGGTWSGSTWSGSNWSGLTWSGGTWSGSTWSGGTWSGGTWSGSTWSGGTWSGGTWSGSTWSGGTWSGDLWSTASWG